MPKPNIVELAKLNTKNVESQYEEVLKSSKDIDKLRNFYSFLESNLKISVNAQHQKFLNIIKGKAYLSAFELTGDYDEAIKHYGSRKEYRIIIDDYFEDGRLFKYFALNSGNMGIPLWGSYCIVLESTYFDYDKTVILKSNSLEKKSDTEYYYFDKLKLNKPLMISELATTNKSNELCIIKHVTSILVAKDSEWSEIVCKCKNVDKHKETNYIEVITFQKCILDANYTVRLKKERIAAIAKGYKTIKRTGKKVKGWDIMKREFDEFKDLYSKFNFKLETI